MLRAEDPKMDWVDFLKRTHEVVGKTDGVNYDRIWWNNSSLKECAETMAVSRTNREVNLVRIWKTSLRWESLYLYALPHSTDVCMCVPMSLWKNTEHQSLSLSWNWHVAIDAGFPVMLLWQYWKSLEKVLLLIDYMGSHLGFITLRDTWRSAKDITSSFIVNVCE